MKVEYIADDGTRFDSKKSCIQYEKALNAFTLYNREYEETARLDMALYVLIESTDAIAALRDLAQSQNEIVDGVDDAGFFVWNEWVDEYSKISDLQYHLDDISELLDKAKAGYKIIMGKEYENNG